MQLLGPVALTVAGATVDLGTPTPRPVLAALALSNGGRAGPSAG